MSDTNSPDATNLRRQWLGLNRRRLLLWALLVGVLCAWIGKPLIRVLHQRQIVARVHALGGEVEYEYDFENGDQRLGEKVVALFFGDVTFAHVTGVGLNSDRPFNDDDLALLTELPEITSLGLTGRHITDRAMQSVAQLPRLEVLGLNSTDVTADGLAQLSAVEGLETLLIGGMTVTDETLKSIGTLSNLRQLGFAESKLGSTGFEHLADLPHLEELAVLDSSMDEGLRNLDSVSSLETLALCNVSITRDGSSLLPSGLTHLKTLRVYGTGNSGLGVSHLADLHNLETLLLQDWSFTDEVLVHLAGLNRLEELRLHSTNVSDDGLVHLKGLEKLQSLDLSDTEVSDAGLKHIAAMTSLRSVSLDRSKVSADGIAVVMNLNGTGVDFYASRQTVVDELIRIFPNN